jgi:hypothetical protein
MTARRTTICIATVALVAVGACVQSLPRRVSGSDLTLPESGERAFLRSLTSRCTDADTLDTTSSRPDPTSRCGSAAGDTVRSTSDPIAPPPQKTP